MINEICCEKTRSYLTSFGTQPPRPWEEILQSKDHETNPAAIDLISQLARMDPNRRLDVHQAINHPFFRPFIKHIPTEPACPFRVSVLHRKYVQNRKIAKVLRESSTQSTKSA